MDTAALAITADEFFSFPGDPDAGKPRYWVARHGLTVTSQVECRDITVEVCDSIEEARAEFAEETCDPGPGGPQVGDTVYIYDTNLRFVVTDVEARSGQGGYPWCRLNAGTDDVHVVFGRYRIASRPEVTS